MRKYYDISMRHSNGEYEWTKREHIYIQEQIMSCQSFSIYFMRKYIHIFKKKWYKKDYHTECAGNFNAGRGREKAFPAFSSCETWLVQKLWSIIMMKRILTSEIISVVGNAFETVNCSDTPNQADGQQGAIHWNDKIEKKINW